MHLTHLSLTHFRNYVQLELELPAPVVLFQGDNGQGKTNLLEAIYFLATVRSLRAGSDRELIGWAALEEPIPFARVAGTVRKAGGELRVEIVIRADRAERPGSSIEESGVASSPLSKRIKINGVAKRALELIGLVNVVMFSPQDLELIAGAPALRRRYLDIANCQVDPRYCRALQQYNRVLLQRNQLLKQIRDGRQAPETLELWSEELARIGSYLLSSRLATVAALNGRIDHYYRRLTGTGKRLKIVYRSSVEEALRGRGDTGTRRHGDAETRGTQGPPLPKGEGRGEGPATGGLGDAETRESQELPLPMGEGRGEGPPSGGPGDAEDPEPRTQNLPQHSSLITHHSSLRWGRGEEDTEVPDQIELFRDALRRTRRREAIQGVSLVGPHRDDLVFRADGIDMNVYGSRGEQRGVALALKLAELEFMQSATGERPILLLDDVMSELDPSRRLLLLETVGSSGQTLITATDLQPFSPRFLEHAALFRIEQGTVSAIGLPRG